MAPSIPRLVAASLQCLRHRHRALPPVRVSVRPCVCASVSESPSPFSYKDASHWTEDRPPPPFVLQISEYQHVSLPSAPTDGFSVTQMEKTRVLKLHTRPPDLALLWASLPAPPLCHTPAMLAFLFFLKHSRHSCLGPLPLLPFPLPECSFPASVLCGFLSHFLQAHDEMSLSGRLPWPLLKMAVPIANSKSHSPAVFLHNASTRMSAPWGRRLRGLFTVLSPGS